MSATQNRVTRAEETRERTQREWKPSGRVDLVTLLNEADPAHAYAWRNIGMLGETTVIEKRLARHLQDGEVQVNPADSSAIFDHPKIKSLVNIQNGRVTRRGQVLTKFPKDLVDSRREYYRRIDTERRTQRVQDGLQGSNVEGMSVSSKDTRRTFNQTA